MNDFTWRHFEGGLCACAGRAEERRHLCPESLVQRQVKHLNNQIESHHGKLKRLIKPTLGFKSMQTAYATIKGFEVMRMSKKGQIAMWYHAQGLMGEIRFIEHQFGIYAA